MKPYLVGCIIGGVGFGIITKAPLLEIVVAVLVAATILFVIHKMVNRP